MAKTGYIGVDETARKIKSIYLGVNGVARKVKIAYVGVNGAARQWYAAGPPREDCLTFSSPTAFSISVASPGWNGTMEYSTDKSTWTVWDGSEIAAADIGGTYELYLSGAGNTKVTDGNSNRWTLTGSDIACNGNIESLLDHATVAAGNHPVMASSCYNSMFYGCTSLTTAPALPATTLVTYCYGYMFQGCTSLTTAPALPATTLATYCYGYMFQGCTSLTTAPALPATTLATYCYGYMFHGCTSLTTAPALPATTLARGCYNAMFQDCTSLTTAPALPATTLATYCYGYMFQGCTSLTTAPALPATTLARGCYRGMFYGCAGIKLSATRTGTYTKVYRIPTSGTGKTADSALTQMFTNTGGTFIGTPTINTTYYLDASNSIVR